jgi:hypothetical protein
LNSCGLCCCRLHPLDAADAALGQADAFAADLPSDSDADAASDAGGPDSEEARDVDGPSTAHDSSSSSSSSSQGPGRDAGSSSRSGQEHSAGRQRHGGRPQVAKLSKFEAGRLEQAKQRHKAQIAQPKVRKTQNRVESQALGQQQSNRTWLKWCTQYIACLFTESKCSADRVACSCSMHIRLLSAMLQAAFGRVFAGDAFISEPPAIEFKDFVPGQAYRMSVQLINRSFTGSSIRLLEVPTEVRICNRGLCPAFATQLWLSKRGIAGGRTECAECHTAHAHLKYWSRFHAVCFDGACNVSTFYCTVMAMSQMLRVSHLLLCCR